MEHQIEIEIPELEIEIEERNHQHRKESLNEKLHGLQPSPAPVEPCIFRSHVWERISNPDAYTPRVVSIGPLHRKNSNLFAMEEHKLRYLQAFLRRGREVALGDNQERPDDLEESLEKCLWEMKKLEYRARKFYAYPIDLESDEFVEMMLLDACFIVEFVFRCEPEVMDDPIFSFGWLRSQIWRDMMLLENQLPYFVLSELFDFNKMPFRDWEKSFKEIVMPMLPRMHNISKDKLVQYHHPHEIKHLLHLLYILCCLSNTRSTATNIGREILRRSVIELQEAGVKFTKVPMDDDSKSDNVSLFDIKFNKGIMEIPCFTVNDSTETFFRNLIGFEQHSGESYPKYFSDYAVFMDQLINSGKDVNLLRLNGIAVNLLGDDNEVALLFNKLSKGVNISSGLYSVVCNNANQHCEKIRNVVMTTLRHDYFRNPWRSLSTVAAVMILIFTLTQTLVSLKSLFD